MASNGQQSPEARTLQYLQHNCPDCGEASMVGAIIMSLGGQSGLLAAQSLRAGNQAQVKAAPKAMYALCYSCLRREKYVPSGTGWERVQAISSQHEGLKGGPDAGSAGPDS